MRALDCNRLSMRRCTRMLDVPPRGSIVRAGLLLLFIASSGCMVRPTAPPPVAQERAQYERAAWTAIPGWSEDSIDEAWAGFRASCAPLQQKPEWREVCSDSQ